MKPTDTLRGIQALRGVAALLVVASHSVEVYGLRVPNPIVDAWPNGRTGVDIFFVISGLVMVLSSARLRARSNSWRIFLARRFERIIPLYWLATAAKVGLVAAAPALALRSRLDWGYLLQSLLMIPANDANGLPLPMLPVGWTLSFEMMFYALFALALGLRVRVLKFVTPILCGIALLAFAKTASWPAVGELANTIVLEFAFGAGIGTLLLHGRGLGARSGAVVAATGFCTLMLVASYSAEFRLIAWGIPAAFVVAGVVGMEKAIGPRLPAWALEIGDASYATYLTHGFIVPVASLTVARLGLHGGAAVTLTVVAGIIASTALGVAVHRVVEQPLLDWMQRRRVRVRALVAP